MAIGKTRIARNVLPSRLWSYFFSYVLLVALLLSVLGGIVYTSFFDTLQRVVEHSNVASLTQIRDQVDQRFADIMKISVQISRNSKLIPHLITENEYEAIQAVNELRSYSSTSSFLLDIGLLLNDADPKRVYAASGIYQSGDFFRSAYPFPDWSKPAFIQELQELRAPRIGAIEPISVNNTLPAPAGYYLYPIPTGGKPYQTIFYILNGVELRNMIAGMLQGYDGYAFVTDKSGRTILSVGKGIYADSPNQEQLQRSIAGLVTDVPIQSIRLPQGEFSTVRLESAHTDWLYYVVMPTAQFIERVERTRTLFYAAIAVVFALGVAASYVLASRNYRPIRALMEIIHRKSPGGRTAVQDELAWISKSFEEVTLENSGLRSQLKTKVGMIKDQVLLHVFQGNIPQGREWEDDLRTTGLMLEGGSYAVMLVQIDHYERFVSENPVPMQNLLKYSITNVAEEIALEYGSGYGITLADDKGVAVLLHLQHATDIQEDAVRISEKIREFFELCFPFTVTIGLSGIFHELERTPLYWNEAYEAAAYRFIRGGNRVIYYRDIASGKYNPALYHALSDSQLMKEIMQGNTAEAGAEAQALLEKLHDSDMPPDAAKSICLNLTGSLIQVTHEFEISGDSGLKATSAALLANRFETLRQFAEAYCRLVGMVTEHIVKKKESKNFELRDKLLHYAEENFTDESMNLQKIADAFGMSPSYVSRYFKNQTGTALSEHIDELRMNSAKELLKAGILNVKDVVKQVGYGDQTHFIRKFKKKYGLTPQQYKMLYMAGGTSRNTSDEEPHEPIGHKT
ncbi:AraC family transcriptional regulator [Paenibacillus thalictri]|uniref:AraC family transcriptional regulator n=1 Tax=Paenibacillus thalictri TaxID=2527873 RepID=A0A4Q9DGB7_9BACL|nr:helix-turn-helix domain-containing protein [Paenibacillus thalictri]TBL70732.1 AraC family transcriptional regulator [Paenibacillus thalictri]